MTLTILAIMILFPWVLEFLRYDRPAILRGEVWRLLSAHIIHLGWSHAGMNLAALILVWMLFNPLFSPAVWFIYTVVSSVLISLALLLSNPELHYYVGFSGVLHTLFVVGALKEALMPLPGNSRVSAWLLLAAVGAKILWEQWAGAMPGSESMAGGAVIVDAHLYGALVGILLGSPFFFKTRLR